MKLKIQFVLSKSSGVLPNISLIHKELQSFDYIKSCMQFMPAFEDVQDMILDWKLLDNGLGDMSFDDDKLVGYPIPVIEFTLDDDSFVKSIEEEKNILHGVWQSAYAFILPGVNENDPFYFEDHNGYSKILE
jgi:hypothetical protein